MESHYTPKHLISRIKRHLPRKFSTALEPAVGDGALLFAMLGGRRIVDVSAFDIRDVSYQLPINELRKTGITIHFKNTCFLEWCVEQHQNQKFDLVLMNPPFSGRSETWVVHDGRKMPIEIAFLRETIRLCKHGGTFIAILPKTIVSGELKCSTEAREYLFENLDVSYCYELTEYEFPSIEGQFYLLIGRKGYNNNAIKLRDMSDGEIKVTRKILYKYGYRLDYSYIRSQFLINNLSSNTKLRILKLSSVADVFRGPLSPPYDKDSVIHTSSFSGHWNVNTSTVFNSRFFNVYVQGGDILVKRVGRDCLDSFGLIAIERKQIATDCILVIRPKSRDLALSILLSLRTIYSSIAGKSYLQKGTGAKFISGTQLSSVPVILNLFNLFPKCKPLYTKAVSQNDYIEMRHVEEYIRSHIFYGNTKDIAHRGLEDAHCVE